MTRLSKLAAVVAALPVLAIAPLAHADGVGQIGQGNIYRVKDVTANGSFATDISSACGHTVQFRVRIHNGGPDTLHNVRVSATLHGNSSTSHGSVVRLSADNNLHNAVVTANAGVNTSGATTADYISGSTQLLDVHGTVLNDLPDGILNAGLNIGDIGPLTADIKSVQFKAKLNCSTPAPKPAPAPAQELPNTGPGEVAGLFASASALGAAGHYIVARRRR
jgi:hypothetical protein